MGKSVGFFNDRVKVSWRSLTPMLYAKAIPGQTADSPSKCDMKNWKEDIAPLVNRTVFPLRPFHVVWKSPP